jgi:O-antigen/teichoic acid export membrane protein
MSSYVGAEPLLLIILLAAPAELFFGVNSGLLQAFGESRKLFVISLGVLVGSIALSPLTYVLGPNYLAGVLVAAYWMLHFLSRHMLSRTGVEEESIILPALAARRRRYWPPASETIGAEVDRL